MTRLVISLVAILVLPLRAFAQQPSPMPRGTGSISGHVTAGDTGKAIAGALVEIVLYENLSGRFGQVATDASGKFQFTDLPAGHFRIAAQATRYMRMQYGQQQPGPVGVLNPARTIELTDAQSFTMADFALSSFCAIEGVLVDEFGDPVPNVVVQVSQVQYAGGRRRLLPANPSLDVGPPRSTDDQGHFRVAGLAPGDYYVEALSGAFADPTAAGGFAVTYFPGTPTASGAQVVSVHSGQDALNVSFALTPAKMAHVSGTVTGADGTPAVGSNLVLIPSERNATVLFMMVRAVANDTGKFSFRNLPPGTYTIQAFGAQAGPGGNLASSAFGYQTFTVDGQDLSDVSVKVPAPRTLRGSITFDSAPPTLPKPGDVFVTTTPIDFESAPMIGGPPPTTVHDDLTFEIRAMSGVRLITGGVRPGWAMKRVLLNGQDVTDTPVDLREHDVNGLEIVVSTTMTTVTGTAVGMDGKPLSDFNVVIFPEDETKWTLPRYIAFPRASQQGAFSVKGLPPASYIAVAVPALLNGEWQDPEFLRKQRVRADAAHVTLSEGETMTLTLTLKK